MNYIQKYLFQNTEAAPLAVFRIFFGLLILLSLLRFYANGWIEKLYIEPNFFFSYYGFEWVKPWGEWTYLLFVICGVSAFFVAIGYRYRWSAVVLFLSFTYIELMDKTLYLNHYYFVSVMSFLLIFLPANAYFSVDAYRDERVKRKEIPRWSILSIQLLLFIVYFYAGLAKLNSDWLFRAMPLKIWLPAKYEIPFLGTLLQSETFHYLFSWSGAIYDLSIPFLLFITKTRRIAFAFVVIFHVLTALLFPIGMFPYIMIVSTLIFFPAKAHHWILRGLAKVFRINKDFFDNNEVHLKNPARGERFLKPFTSQLRQKLIFTFFSLFFFLQFLLPFRYLLYPGELFWTEQGFRFSWRVMLMEKAGYANFKIVEPIANKRLYVDNSQFLTPLQEKQMSTQPDMILEYAHFLKKQYEKEGFKNVEVYVESYVALNGRRSQLYIDPKVDLGKIQPSFKHRDWILPFGDEIKGF